MTPENRKPLDVPVSELRALAAALSQAGGAGE